jgi:hypothetical protein
VAEEEHGWGGDGGEEWEEGEEGGGEDEDEDDQTVVGHGAKRVTVAIKKHGVTRSLYFVDVRGNKRTTSRDDWRKVDGGYELHTRKHIYFTKRFS